MFILRLFLESQKRKFLSWDIFCLLGINNDDTHTNIFTCIFTIEYKNMDQLYQGCVLIKDMFINSQ